MNILLTGIYFESISVTYINWYELNALFTYLGHSWNVFDIGEYNPAVNSGVLIVVLLTKYLPIVPSLQSI